MTDKDNTGKDTISTADLEDLFAQARAAPPALPEALMARVLADAQAVQPASSAGRAARDGLRGWLRRLGGAPGLSGLVAATCVGFWLGVAPPFGVPDLAGSVIGFDVTLDSGSAETSLSMLGFGWDTEDG